MKTGRNESLSALLTATNWQLTLSPFSLDFATYEQMSPSTCHSSTLFVYRIDHDLRATRLFSANWGKDSKKSGEVFSLQSFPLSPILLFSLLSLLFERRSPKFFARFALLCRSVLFRLPLFLSRALFSGRKFALGKPVKFCESRGRYFYFFVINSRNFWRVKKGAEN